MIFDMAKHEFGIMDTAPIWGERYDAYEPQKYHCIAVHDDDIVNILSAFDNVDCYWHTFDVPKKGLAYYGVTLIPPTSHKYFISVMENITELSACKALFERAGIEHKFIIHFGI